MCHYYGGDDDDDDDDDDDNFNKHGVCNWINVGEYISQFLCSVKIWLMKDLVEILLSNELAMC
jgi:hypothetical protein